MARSDPTDPGSPPGKQPESSGALHQISMSYVAVEDRAQLILITAADEDLRFWMTRRFVSGLWGVLMKGLQAFPDLQRVIDRDARQAMMSMRHHEAVQQSDFATPRKESSDPKPAKRCPLLVGASLKQVNSQVVALSLQTRAKKNLTLNLDEKLLHALCHLVVQTSVGAEWDLELAVGDGNLVPPSQGRVVH